MNSSLLSSNIVWRKEFPIPAVSLLIFSKVTHFMLSDPGVPGRLSSIIVLIGLGEEKQNWFHLSRERAVNVDIEPGSQGS